MVGSSEAQQVVSDGGAAEEPRPFDGLGEVREEHDRLLVAIDRAAGDDASSEAEWEAVRRREAEIRTFIARGGLTGAWLEGPRERTACQVLLEYWTTALSRAGRVVPMPRLAPFDADALPALLPEACPYVGLEPFRSARYFHGREADTKRLVELVRASPLVVVSGASGSGKSSLVMGGALPALDRREAQGAPLVMPPFTPGTEPLRALAAALSSIGARSLAPQVLASDPAALASVLSGHLAPAVLTVDQFEEVFTLASPEDRDALAAALAALLASSNAHRVILTVREEFKSAMVSPGPLTPWMKGAFFDVQPLSGEELRAAVERPAAAANLVFQARIVDDLVEKVQGQRAALPLLQFTLRELWVRRSRNRITWEAYTDVGNPLVALERAADAFYEGLIRAQKDEVRRILLELVRVDELLEAYRQPVRRSRLLAAGSASTEEALRRLVEVEFATAEGEGDDAIVELRHEALVRNWPLLVTWIREKREAHRQRLVLGESARRWIDAGRPPAALLTGWQIKEADATGDLSPLERELVAASRAALDASARASERRRRRTIVVLVVLLVWAVLLLLVSIGCYLSLKQQKEENAKEHERKTKNLEAKYRALEKESERLADENKKVTREKAAVDQANQQLTEQLAASVAKTVRPGEGPVTISLHISGEEQRPRAKDLAAQLRKQRIRVPEISLGNPVPSSEVLYFRAADAAQALKISKLLGDFGLGSELPKPELVKGFEGKASGSQFEIWFARGALGGGGREALPAVAAEYLLVFGNDTDCGEAAGTYLRTRDALSKALGSEFEGAGLRILSGNAQGKDYLVTTYGHHLTHESAFDLERRLEGRPGVPADLYANRRQFYRDAQNCDPAAGARQRLLALAKRYVSCRALTLSGAARTAEMTNLFRGMVGAAGLAGLSSDEVVTMHGSASDPEGGRIAALAAIQAGPATAHLPLLLESIRNPQSAFEQYQALAGLVKLAPALPPRERCAMRAALQTAWEADAVHVKEDESRAPTVRRLLSTVDAAGCP